MVVHFGLQGVPEKELKRNQRFRTHVCKFQRFMATIVDLLPQISRSDELIQIIRYVHLTRGNNYDLGIVRIKGHIVILICSLNIAEFLNLFKGIKTHVESYVYFTFRIVGRQHCNIKTMSFTADKWLLFKNVLISVLCNDISQVSNYFFLHVPKWENEFMVTN